MKRHRTGDAGVPTMLFLHLGVFPSGNSLSCILKKCTLFCIYAILQEKSSKQQQTTKPTRFQKWQFPGLSEETSASFASFFSKAIHSARCHNREQQKYQ